MDTRGWQIPEGALSLFATTRTLEDCASNGYLATDADVVLAEILADVYVFGFCALLKENRR